MLTVHAAIAANRFGLGARPGDAEHIGLDPQAWLLSQIEPDAATADTASDSDSATTLIRTGELLQARRTAQQQSDDAQSELVREARQAYSSFVTDQYRTQANIAYRTAIETERPFRERLVNFWANHFAVSTDKAAVRPIAGQYVDEAIRPRITGNFKDLLTASIKHPAMLLYLDNVASIGPNSVLGTRANRNRRAGLNENLAREILELHTLGVDGGYTQDDIVEFARALTGWSVAGQGPGANLAAGLRRLAGGGAPGEPGRFAFRPAVHEPGTKHVLGRRFPETGQGETESVLTYLATQPATARFLATKLARHFIADDPPANIVDRLAATYLDNDGELAPVYAALIAADECWHEPQSKYKTPREFLVSSYRAIGVVPANDPYVSLATQLGQRPMTPGSPAGWPDTAAHWNGGDALLKRIEWASRVGRNIGDRIDAMARMDGVLGETASQASRDAVARAESGGQAVTLLLSAPEFQRR